MDRKTLEQVRLRASTYSKKYKREAHIHNVLFYAFGITALVSAALTPVNPLFGIGATIAVSINTLVKPGKRSEKHKSTSRDLSKLSDRAARSMVNPDVLYDYSLLAVECELEYRSILDKSDMLLKDNGRESLYSTLKRKKKGLEPARCD